LWTVLCITKPLITLDPMHNEFILDPPARPLWGFSLEPHSLG
jgi:hypothetical protein